MAFLEMLGYFEEQLRIEIKSHCPNIFLDRKAQKHEENILSRKKWKKYNVWTLTDQLLSLLVSLSGVGIGLCSGTCSSFNFQIIKHGLPPATCKKL